MLLQYAAIAAFVIITALIGFIAIGMGMLFGPKKSTDKKAMPYEFGYEPHRPRHTPDTGAVLYGRRLVHLVRH